MNQLKGLILIAGLACIGLVSVGAGIGLELTKASAQTVPGLPPQSTAQLPEMQQTWIGTLSTSALGVICTTTSTNTRVSVKWMEITCATAQTVDIYDGSVVGSNVLAHVYCIANTPRVIKREDLGFGGITGSLGNSMTILGGSTGVCSIIYAVQRPTQ